MKSLMTGCLLFSFLLLSCYSGNSDGEEQMEKIATAVKASPVFAESDLRDFKKLDTLFITANELPRYRRLLDDMNVYDSLLKDAEQVRDRKPAIDHKTDQHVKEDIGEFIETIKSDKESKKNELATLIDNTTDTIYRIECTENLKGNNNAIAVTQATVYVNSHFKVIDYDH
ncbi:MAG: hypothetical protein ABW007_22410 [Chitinophagaceae bacterium]